MARHTGTNANKIYKIATNFLHNCLLKDGSLLFSNEEVWNHRTLEEFCYILEKNPDQGNRKFLDKLQDQIKDKDDKVIKLTAEILTVYFLFLSNVTGEKKQENVNFVLGLCGKSLPTSGDLIDAFSTGIGSGGQGYNTRRPTEIIFLSKFADEWKKLDEPQQKSKAEDPWEFQDFMDGIENADSVLIRHMLLHLVFPEHFEHMATSNHKNRLVNHFSKLITKSSGNIDKDILGIRRELEKLRPGEQLDFYCSPLKEAWIGDDDRASAGAPLEIIEYKKQIVLYGPPGTGKTYRAKELAKYIIRSAALRKWGASDYFRKESAIQDAVANNVHRLQLHPAYSYEDFIRALHISGKGGTEYRAGYLPRLIENIEKQRKEERLPHILILDEMNRTDLSRMFGECFSLLEDRDQSIDLPARNEEGAAMTLHIPDDLFVIGTMNLIDQSVEQIDFALRRRFLWISCPFDAEAFMKAVEFQWNELGLPLKWDRVKPDFRDLAATATALNNEIHKSPLLGPQYEIGHTYLLDVAEFLRNTSDIQNTRKQNFLWNRQGEALEPVKQLWRLSLQPLLEQYLAGLGADERNSQLENLSKIFFKRPESK
ncbi:AAA family ATPase [Comamonas sp. NLF-1-9]|uniref:AAA family ATPase n=1 Tax=Comamonas sp. NLF-1-9 TaxID=2853163 RepID=UPI001C476678|nr:AAA family ATPase [Comamonas sp. NLF-1-9]QXL85240.1 AAA family ATPase [Comamonas sp. NLF-1-9]